MISSCYEKQEGCLDIRAKNYSFSSDIPCEDCCTYPDMKLRVVHEWDEEVLNSGKWYINDLGQSIKILSSKFYLSEIALTHQGELFTVTDQLRVTNIAGQSSTIRNDIIFVQSSRVNYTVGKFSHAQTFDGITYKVGIDGNYIAEDDEETFIEEEDFFDVTKYEHTNLKLEVVVDSVRMDTMAIDLAGQEFVMPITLDGLLEIPLGVDFTVPIFAEYLILLRNINFDRLSEDNEKEKILKNLKGIFHF